MRKGKEKRGNCKYKVLKWDGGGVGELPNAQYIPICVHQVNRLHSDLSGAGKDSVVDVIGICKLTNDSVNITTR